MHEPLSKIGSLLLAGMAAVACHGARPATEAGAQPSGVIVLALPAFPDSAVRLAKFAMRAIEGHLQLPKISGKRTTISTHYLRNRRGGGHTEIAIIAAVGRRAAESSAPLTIIHLSAWRLDVAHQLTAAERRAGVPLTPITTNAPALRHPRLITPADTSDWQSLQYVRESFVMHGARPVP